MLITVRLMLILVCCVFLTLADKKNCDEGVIYPKEPYFLDGQDLVLTCERKHKATASDLYFKTSDGYGRVSLDEKYMERNETAVTLRIPNISKEFVANNSISSSYYCYDRGKRGESDVCISNEYVFLDYYPQKAENLSCMIDNWDSMICTWGLTVEYKNPDNYKVSCQFLQNISSKWNNETVSKLLYALRNDVSKWAVCPEGNKTSCYWRSSEYHDALMYIMTVAVTNTRLNITTYMEEQVFWREDIVKPAPVKTTDIAVEYFPEDPESIGIQWNHSSSSLRNLLFSLTIISACDTSKVYERNYTPIVSYINDEEIIPAQQMLMGLNPNTQYNFSIKAKALGGSGPWSEPTEKHFTTLSTVPRSAPHTRNGWFETLPGRCTTARNCENILIHWQPLSQCDIISNTTRYRLSSPLANVTQESTKFSAEIEVLSNRSSVLRLRAVSDEGVSTNYSMQEVYPEDQWPKIQRDLVIEYNTRTGVCNATVMVLENDDSFDDISHTIVWCKGGAKCKAPIDSFVVAENQTSKILPVSHCEHDYRVGITTSGRRVATGEIIATKISWVPCMFEEEKVPKVPLPAVEIFNISGYAFRVAWSPYTCNTPDINYVEYYRVSHCLVNGTDNCSCIGEVSGMDVSKQDHSVKVVLSPTTLKTGSNICVWVKAKTRGGFGPRNTNDLYYTVGEPSHGEASKGSGESGTNYVVIGGAVGGVFALIGIIFGIFCICKKCWRHLKPVPIEMPRINDNVPLEENHHATDILNAENETGPLIPENDSGTHTMSAHSSDSNDSATLETETEIRNPLLGLLAQGTSRSGYGYNRVPTEPDEYLLDASNTSVGVPIPTAEIQEENIYEEINSIPSQGSIPSQLDTEYMYLHPLDRPPSASLDQVQQSKDSVVVTDNANVLDVQDNFANNEEDKSLQAELVLVEKHVHDAEDNFVSDRAEDRFLQTEPVTLKNDSVNVNAMDRSLQTETVTLKDDFIHDSPMDKVQKLDCDLDMKEMTEDVEERSKFEILPTRCGQSDSSKNQNLNIANKMTEGIEKRSECLDLPTHCGQYSDFDFPWEHHVASGNQNLNIVIENSAIGYTSVSNIELSESGSSEIDFDSGSGIDNSDSSTSHTTSNIQHISSHEHNVIVDRLETHLDSQQNNEPRDETRDTSNSELTKTNNVIVLQNDQVFIEETLNSKTDKQKHVGNDKLKGGNSSGYSKATLYDQK